MKVTMSRRINALTRVLPASLVVIALSCWLSALSWAGGGSGSDVASKTNTGSGLYKMHCARCHSERYPTERTDAQWKTVMLHMRTRAQIPAKDANTILEYLQESN